METEATRRASKRPADFLTLCRFFHFIGLALCLSGPVTREVAGVEPLPVYGSATQLREDSTLWRVAFVDAVSGVAVGDRGTVLQSIDGGTTWLHRESGVECVLSDVIWLSPNRVVAVGGGYDRLTQVSRGVAVYSDDGGKIWRRAADRELPRLHRLRFDASRNVLVASGDWSAISLTQHYVTRDGGKTWTADDTLLDERAEISEPTANEIAQWAKATAMSGAIRSACRVGARGILAVGDHGAVHFSDDGGQTWQSRRGSNRRASVLVVAQRATEVPWALVGNESLELGHRTAVLVLDPSAVHRASPTAPRVLDLARHAAMSLGAISLDAVSEQDLENWIAIHQPSAIVWSDSVDVAVRSRATDFAIQSGVQRVVIASPRESRGEVRLQPSALLPRTAVLAGDFNRDALDWLAPQHRGHESISLKRIYDLAEDSLRGDSVVAGMNLASAYRLTAEPPQASRRQLQIIQARLNQPQQIAQILALEGSPESFASAIRSLLSQSANADRYRLAWSLYRQVLAASLQPSADPVRVIDDRERTLLKVLAEFEEISPLDHWARLRLDAMENSREWRRVSRWQSFNRNRASVANVQPAETLADVGQVALSPFQITESQSLGNRSSGVIPVSATSPVIVPDMTPEDAVAVAAGSLTQLENPTQRNSGSRANRSVDLAWEFHPLVLMVRDLRRRSASIESLARVQESQGNLGRLAQSALSRDWHRISAGSDVVAARAATPPRLDGHLDEPFWQRSGVPLGGSEAPMQWRAAYDDEFLYLAVQYVGTSDNRDPQPRGTLAPSTSVRDNDLTYVDRLGISIDVDGDLLTAYRLETTADRLTRDAIDHQLQWQPTWYVAHFENETGSTFEIAISMHDLVDARPTSGEHWLCETRWMRAGTSSQPDAIPAPLNWVRFRFE